MSFFKYGMVVDGDSPRHGRWPHVTGVTPEYFVTDRLQWLEVPHFFGHGDSHTPVNKG